ncbi:MAG TPA: hypothetical protein VN862_04440 [Candidatus Acidoferrales bacterium]|nr:hypothetical protein [Candidatus Acidoferrales bacterium]
MCKLRIFLAASFLLTTGHLARGQEAASPPSHASAPAADQMQALSESLRQLQAQLQALSSKMGELQAQEQSSRDEARTLRRELELTRAELAASARNSSANPTPADATSSAPQASSSTVSDPQTANPQTPTTDERLSKLEENQQFIDDKVNEQYQDKVESGSKYRVRLSGMALLNVFSNRGTVDNVDFPEIALEPDGLSSPGTFGGSLRQTQIGLEAFGPDIFGAHTSASVKFDFAGGFPETPNGVATGLVRLRTGTIRFDWENTSLVAGQDYLFFAPLAPTSLASTAIPALSYAGNLWAWTPQVRVEHHVTLSDTSKLTLAAGILDSFSGDIPYSTTERYPSWGEESGQPAYAARVALSHKAFGEDVTFGVGGYYGRQYWGFGRNVNGWVGTADLTVPLGKDFEFTGEFYRGNALGGLGGGIGQDVVMSGSLLDAGTVVRGLDSMGGWVQLKYKATPKLQFNAAIGDDNPFASELRQYASTPGYYGVVLSRNLSPFVNFIYQLRSNVMVSVEYRRLQTFQFDSDSYSANHIGLSLGYIF